MGTKNDPGAFDCYENAEPSEPIFVLLARDVCAPGTVLAWAEAREQRLRAFEGEAPVSEIMTELDQIAEARKCALDMIDWRKENRD